MKLYTEEQVIQMIEKSRETGLTAEYLILTTTPIKLPSDEEIHKEEHGQTWDDAIENIKARGGNDMRAWADFDDYYNQRFGGNNEQQ